MYITTLNDKLYNVHTSIAEAIDELMSKARNGVDNMSHRLIFTIFTLTIDDNTYRILRDREIDEFVDKAGDQEIRLLLKMMRSKS